MPISMSLKANYKTQTAAYDKLLIGKPLSTYAIRKYAKQGRYGPAMQAAMLRKPTSRIRRTPKQTAAKRVTNLVDRLLQSE